VDLGDQPAVVSHPGQLLKMLTKGKNFLHENNHLLEQPPRGCGRVLIPGGFQDVIGQGAG